MASVVGGFQPGTASIPSSQVEISVSCRNLRNMDTFSKSDPMCVLFTKDLKSGRFFEYSRTETIQDNLNPQFVKKFVLNYFFEECQRLRFDIYDVDSTSQRLDQHDFLGTIEVTLGELVGAIGGKTSKNLQGNSQHAQHAQNNGTITIRTEELSSCKEVCTMQFRATKLDKMDWFGKSDPTLWFHRANEDNSYTVVYKTEVIKNTLNPTWKPFTISAKSLCNGDYDRSIKVQCFDWNSDGSHDLIGEFITNLREFSNGPGPNNQYEVVNPEKKRKKKKYHNSGLENAYKSPKEDVYSIDLKPLQVDLISCRIETQSSFLDYIKGGMQMNFTVAIDFTASNGNPQNPTSLHYLNPYQMNQYASAITAVGEIVQDYDSDKLFPSLGFGARLRDGSVSHEFALNFNPSNPYCEGIAGVLQAYYNAIQNVQLYGPTNFAPVINHVARFASAARDGSNYFVLLIITDGVISDMPQTVKAIVEASWLPMSIIIVGVGNADFDAMDVLDGDDVRLSSHGKTAVRDIVQFVPFRDFLGSQTTDVLSRAALAKEVLAEVPDQILSYMNMHKLKPKPPLQAQDSIMSNTPPPSY